MGPLNPHDRNDPDALPARDAWLQSYLDGELGPEDRARVEAWLADDPTARAQADAAQRLDDLFVEGVIEEPSPRAWDRTLGRISQEVTGRPSGPLSRFGKKVWPFLWVAAAAAILAGVWLGARLLGPAPSPPKPDGPAVEVFEVAGAADVVIDEMDPYDGKAIVVGTVPMDVPEEMRQRTAFAVARDFEIAIISMDGEDTETLVVGDPPIVGSLLMALPGEVKVDYIETVKGDDPKPKYHETRGSGGMPMIMVPFRSVRKD